MNRREFLTASAATAVSAASLASPGLGPLESARAAAMADGSAPSPGGCLSIRDYLCSEARRITRGALADLGSASAWRARIGEKRRQYLEMMGVDSIFASEQRPPVPVHITGTVDRPSYRIEKLHYESLPGLHVTANLYVPKRPIAAQAPAVLYVCGHAQNQKAHYQAHPRRFAELGFVCLIAETIELGEVPGNHHGCYRDGLFQWYSRGYSPAAVELWNGIRGLDLLAARPDVDPKALGVTGISGGGAATWWIAAGDERIRAAAPVCGTATLESHIYDRVIDGHCDCMWWPNLYGWDLADVGALIAPRPLLIASADHDGIFPIDSIRRVHRQLAALYGRLGAAERLRLVETPGGHSYHEKSRTAIFAWFLRHLAGKEEPESQVGDVDESRQETLDTLRVYVNGAPAANCALTIAEDFVPLAKPPEIDSASALRAERKRVVDGLRRTTFRAFPARPPVLDARAEYALDGDSGYRFAYTSEVGVRLHGKLAAPASAEANPLPALVTLRSPGEERNAAESLAGRVRGNWARVAIEPRGAGDTGWAEDMNWHLRRAAAWSGRTLASIRVWDTLRALGALRKLPRVDSGRVAILGRGEMAVVALFAALMDGSVQTVLLESPPASLNEPSRPDGRGAAVELLGVLKWIDLPQAAGLLFPAEVVVAGDARAYGWAEELYGALGKPKRFHLVDRLESWPAA